MEDYILSCNTRKISHDNIVRALNYLIETIGDRRRLASSRDPYLLFKVEF
jgi:hypothetical protein